MKKKLLVATALTALAGSAMAQSAFEGFYGQVGIGYESNSVKNSDASFNGTAIGGSETLNANGFSGAIGIGYGFSVSKDWILTIGADYSPLNVNSKTQPFGDTDYKYEVSNRYNIFLAPGYQIDKDKLAYLKAGYSGAQVKTSGDLGQFFGSPTTNLSGYVLGLGYKQLFDKNIYLFGEANYMSYGNATTNASGAENGSTTTTSYKLGANSYQFLVGVGYKF